MQLFMIGILMLTSVFFGFKYFKLRRIILDNNYTVSFAEGDPDSDIEYINSLVEWPEEYARTLIKEDESLGRRGSGWAFDRSFKVNEFLKSQKKPISLHGVKNTLCHLRKFKQKVVEAIK